MFHTISTPTMLRRKRQVQLVQILLLVVIVWNMYTASVVDAISSSVSVVGCDGNGMAAFQLEDDNTNGTRPIISMETVSSFVDAAIEVTIDGQPITSSKGGSSNNPDFPIGQDLVLNITALDTTDGYVGFLVRMQVSVESSPLTNTTLVPGVNTGIATACASISNVMGITTTDLTVKTTSTGMIRFNTEALNVIFDISVMMLANNNDDNNSTNSTQYAYSQPILVNFRQGGTPADSRLAPAPNAPVYINEFHYNNDGTDEGEFIEIAHIGSLAGYSIVLYNGEQNSLNGLTYDISDFVPSPTTTQDGISYTVFEYPSNGIQNGDPDGIALVGPDGTVLEFLSYGGAFTALEGPAVNLFSTDIGVTESATTPIGYTLQRVNGGWVGPIFNTKGFANAAILVPVVSPIASPVIVYPPSSAYISEFHYDNDGADEGEFIEIAHIGSLAGYSIALYNGEQNSLYGRTYDITNLIPSPTSTQDGISYTVFEYPFNGIQNGNPDGIALVAPDGSVVQFLSYGGAFVALDGPAANLLSFDIGVIEDASTLLGQSLQFVNGGWVGPLDNTKGFANGPVVSPVLSPVIVSPPVIGATYEPTLYYGNTKTPFPTSYESYGKGKGKGISSGKGCSGDDVFSGKGVMILYGDDYYTHGKGILYGDDYYNGKGKGGGMLMAMIMGGSGKDCDSKDGMMMMMMMGEKGGGGKAKGKGIRYTTNNVFANNIDD